MTRLRDGIDMKTYMELYTAVHNFCTSQKSMTQANQIGSGQGQRGGKEERFYVPNGAQVRVQ